MVRIPDERAPNATASEDLGSGAAGRSLFFLELYHATDDSTFLQSARHEIDAALAGAPPGSPLRERAGLYNGLAGVMFAAAEMYRATGAPRYRLAAYRLRDTLASTANGNAANGATWGPVDDVIAGNAGIGLGLLYLATVHADTVSLYLARRVGNDLVHRGRTEGEGLWWSPSHESDLNLPNFSHGTAGVGFFLAVLHQVTGDVVFLDAARRAAAYLETIASRFDGLFLVPYGIPDEGYVTAFDIGWAHGPAGTAALFVTLGEITGRTEFHSLVEANARTLVATGMPDASRDPTLWTGPFRIDRRFGTSGAAVFLARYSRDQSDSPYRELARTIMDSVIARGTHDEHGLRWQLPLYPFQGDEGTTAAFSGFFYGSAGLGLALLDLHYAETETDAFIRWPDDPFAAGGSRMSRR